MTTIERDGPPIAALVHDPALDDEPARSSSSRSARASRSRTCGSRPTSARSSASSSPSRTRRRACSSRSTRRPDRNQNRAAVEASGLPDDEADCAASSSGTSSSTRRARGDAEALLGRRARLPAAQYENTFMNAEGRAARDRLAQRARHRRAGRVGASSPAASTSPSASSARCSSSASATSRTR